MAKEGLDKFADGEQPPSSKMNRNLELGMPLSAHEQDTPDMTLKVIDGVTQGVKYDGGNSPSFSAPSSDDRIDLLVMDTNGSLSIETGTEDPSPTTPDYPEGEFVICEVYLRPGATQIKNEDDSSEAYIQRSVRSWSPEPLPEFGNGKHGDVTLSSNTTLSEDKFYRNLTIESGNTLDTNGYRVYVSQKLTNNGIIENNGSDGSDGEDGSGSKSNGGGGGAGADGNTLDSGTSGGAGGDGQEGAGGIDGNDGTNKNPALGPNGSAGGDGSTGSRGSAGSGGAAGTATSENAKAVIRFLENTLTAGSEIIDSLAAFLSGASSGLSLSTSAGGGGGGGGASSTGGQSAGAGGGAGGSGGIVYIIARIIDNTNGTIRALGGAGGNGGANEGGGGGGAGGSGGVVALVYRLLIAAGTIDVSGGAAGTAPGTGNDGTAGNTGKIYKLKI